MTRALEVETNDPAFRPVLTARERVRAVRDSGVVVLQSADGHIRTVRVPLERVPALRQLLARLHELESPGT